MLSQVCYIAALHIKQFTQQPATFVYFLLVPLLFTFALGQASGAPSGALETLEVAVVNQDTGDLGQHLLARVQADSRLRVQLTTDQAAIGQVNDRGVAAALIIPADFSSRLLAGQNVTLQLHAHSSDSQKAQVVEKIIQVYVAQLDGALQTRQIAVQVAIRLSLLEERDLAQQQEYAEEAFNAAKASWQAASLVNYDLVAADPASGHEAQPGGYTQASPGMLVMFSLFAFLGGGVVLIYERQEGTLPRLMVMPIQKASFLVGKLLGIYLVGIAQITLLILAGAVLFNVNWGPDPIALILLVASFAAAATSLGILMGTFVRTPAQATVLNNIVVLVMSALGGAWWPLALEPEWLQVLGHIFPSAWAMDAFQDILARGLGTAAILPEVGVLLGFGAVSIAIGTWRFRYE